MEYVFFPGCKVLSSDPYMESSTKLVLKELGVTLLEDKNFSCCGPTIVSSLEQTSALAINARNLCIAESSHQKDLFTLCSWCYKTLNEANELLKADREKNDKINSILKGLGKKYNGTIKIKNLLQILIEIGEDNLKLKFNKSLSEMKIAAFLGCHLRGKGSDEFDSSFVSDLDKLVEMTGAQNIYFEEKFLCCGGLVGYLSEVETEFNYKIIQRLSNLDIDALVVNCPYCFNRFNEAIMALKKEGKGAVQMNVVYLPDLLGLAMGFSPEELALENRLNNLDTLLDKIKNK